MKTKSSTYKWIMIFGVILLMTQVNLFISFSALPSFLGFPKWLWLMIGVHLLFVLALFRFTKTDDEP